MDLNRRNVKKILFIVAFAIVLFLGLQNIDKDVYKRQDGEQGIPVQMGDEVLICKSETSVKLINLTGKLFYQVLNDKLLYGSEWQTKPSRI